MLCQSADEQWTGLMRLGQSRITTTHTPKVNLCSARFPFNISNNIIKFHHSKISEICKITYATSDSAHSCLLVPSISRHTRPTNSIHRIQGWAAKESNAIGFNQLQMHMRNQQLLYFLEIVWSGLPSPLGLEDAVGPRHATRER